MNRLEQYIGDLNPSCWLNADQVNGFGVAQPVLDSDISIWKDLSGNNRDFTYSNTFVTTTNKPKFKNFSFYGQNQNTVYFDSSNNQFLSYVMDTGLFSSNQSTLILISRSISGDSLYNQSYGNGGANCKIGVISGSGALGYKDNYDLNGGQFGNRYVSNDFRYGSDVYIFQCSKETTTNARNGISRGIRLNAFNDRLKKNPAPQLEDNQSLYYLYRASDRLCLGGVFVLTNNTVSSFSSGYIFEHIFFDRILNNQEISQVQSYLKQKYNI